MESRLWSILRQFQETDEGKTNWVCCSFTFGIWFGGFGFLIITSRPRIPSWFVLHPAIGVETVLLSSDKVLIWIFKLLVKANRVMLRYTSRIWFGSFGFSIIISIPRIPSWFIFNPEIGMETDLSRSDIVG